MQTNTCETYYVMKYNNAKNTLKPIQPCNV